MNSNNNASFSSLKPGTRILFANFPADGHFNPLTGLAAHLKAIGCDVRWYTSKTYQQKIENLNIPFYPFKRALDFFTDMGGIEAPERMKQKGKVAKLNYDIINAFVLRGAEMFEDIKLVRKEFDFDVVVADICFTAIPFIKDKMNVPVISVGIMPISETSRDLPPSGLGMTPDNTFLGRTRQAFLRLLARKVLFAKSQKVLRSEFDRYQITGGDELIFDVMYSKSDLILQSGCPAFEYQRSDFNPKIKFIGALLPYSNRKKQAKPWFDERLTKYRKAVLVTQGTVEKDVNKILVPTLEAFKGSDVLVIATTGGSGTAELRQRYPHDNIIIEDFIPFDDVMPYVQTYITNGGYGGVMLGIQHGLPLVVAGVHEGKNEINARIGYFRYGINLKTETPKPVQIRCAVEDILDHEVYQANVVRLRNELAAYQPAALCEHYIARLLPAKKAATVAEELEEAIY